jgi:hypothetical protein
LGRQAISSASTQEKIVDQLITQKHAAKLLQLSGRTLERLRVAGGGPVYIKLGRAVRYRPHDLHDWLDGRRRTSTSNKSNDTSHPDLNEDLVPPVFNDVNGKVRGAGHE